MKDISGIIPLEPNILIYIIGLICLLLASFFALFAFWRLVRSGVVFTFWIVVILIITIHFFPNTTIFKDRRNEIASILRENEWLAKIVSAVNIKIS